MKKLCYLLFSLTVLATSPLATASSTWRCGSNLVSLGDTTSMVERKCGEPVRKSFRGYQRAINIYYHVNEVPVEEWEYGPNHGMYHQLRFVDNELTKISSHR